MKDNIMVRGSTRLRQLMRGDLPVYAPVVMDPLSAKIAENAGFQAVYVGGGAMGWTKANTEANVSLTQMAQAGLEIRAVCDLPMIMDGTCGWGEPMHIHYTISMAEAAGFAAIEIEDQLIPKRAHHHLGVEHLIPTEDMVHKIEEAVAARRDEDFVIIARTNACRTDTVDEAVRRGEAYRKAGADVLLLLQKTPEEARWIAERIDAPLMYMMLAGPESVGMSLRELGELGYAIVIDGTTPDLARAKALRLAYEALAEWRPDPTVAGDRSDETRRVHEAVGLSKLVEIERRTVET
jgi:2-methylisocitrate lyase-like PEP mutase family enzyme